MIRTEDPRLLFELLTDTLGLPKGQPPTTYPGPFTNAVVGAGNVPLELIRFGPVPDPPPSEAKAWLWGISFEPAGPLSEIQKELDDRRIPRLAPQAFQRPTLEGGLQKMWTNLSVSMLEHTRRAKAFFFVGRLLGGLFGKMQGRQMRRLTKTPNTEEAQWMDEKRMDAMNDVTGHGWVFLTEYDPEFLNPEQSRVEGQRAFQEHGGGPLGIQAVEEIQVGTTNLDAAREQWRRFFTPTPEKEPGLWKVGDGPAVRILPHGENRLLSLVLKVVSLEKARSFLKQQGMLEFSDENEIEVSPASVGGLRIRLKG